MSEDQTFSSAQMAHLCSVNVQTIGRWCRDEFGDYLSDLANPSGNRPRKFTEHDAQTLLLIAQLKEGGATNTEVHAALRNPQRPSLPSDLIMPTATPANQYERQIMALSGQLDALRIENAVLKSKVERTEELERTVRDLERLIGRLEYEIETLRGGK